MGTLVDVGRRLGTMALLLVAATALVLAVGKDSPAEAATGTKIVLSKSSTSIQPVQRIVLFPNGPTKTYYIWAQNVKDNFGLSAFQLRFEFDESVVSVTQLDKSQTWLGSTGRPITCIPPSAQSGWTNQAPYLRQTEDPTDPPEIWEATTGCHSGPSANLGPQGSGLLATVSVGPASTVPAASTLDFAIPYTTYGLTYETWLVNTNVTSPPTEIAATVPTITIAMIKCADFNADNVVSLGEILTLAAKFGWTTSHPQWNPIYDLDNSGAISLGNILDAAAQFAQYCS